MPRPLFAATIHSVPHTMCRRVTAKKCALLLKKYPPMQRRKIRTLSSFRKTGRRSRGTAMSLPTKTACRLRKPIRRTWMRSTDAAAKIRFTAKGERAKRHLRGRPHILSVRAKNFRKKVRPSFRSITVLPEPRSPTLTRKTPRRVLSVLPRPIEISLLFRNKADTGENIIRTAKIETT